MVKILRIHCWPLLTLFLALSLNATKSPRELLRQSSELFDEGRYGEALKIIENIDIRSAFDSSEDMKLAFKIRAIAYSQIGQEKEAREIIKELLFIDPNYKFDPFDTPPVVIRLAVEEQKAILEKNERLALVRPNTESSAISPPEKKLAINAPPSFATSLFPFGINHYYLGSPVKGSIYLGLQTLGLAANIGAFWWKQSYLQKFGVARLENNAHKNRFQAAQVVQYVALSTLLVAFGVSVVDAIIEINKPTPDPKNPKLAKNNWDY